MKSTTELCLLVSSLCAALLASLSVALMGCKTPDIPPIPIPTFPSVTTTTQPPTTDELGGPYKITKKIELVSATGSGVIITGEDCHDWQNDGACYGECHIYIYRDGKWIGGKFDHQRFDNAIRGYKHIYAGYGSWKDISPKPTTGEKACFCVVSYDHAQRSNAVFFDWPTNGE